MNCKQISQICKPVITAVLIKYDFTVISLVLFLGGLFKRGLIQGYAYSRGAYSSGVLIQGGLFKGDANSRGGGLFKEGAYSRGGLFKGDAYLIVGLSRCGHLFKWGTYLKECANLNKKGNQYFLWGLIRIFLNSKRTHRAQKTNLKVVKMSRRC